MTSSLPPKITPRTDATAFSISVRRSSDTSENWPFRWATAFLMVCRCRIASFSLCSRGEGCPRLRHSTFQPDFRMYLPECPSVSTFAMSRALQPHVMSPQLRLTQNARLQGVGLDRVVIRYSRQFATQRTRGPIGIYLLRLHHACHQTCTNTSWSK